MMTYEMMVTALEALGESISYYVSDGMFHVTIEDFEGFDEAWDEVEAEYDVEAVDAFLEMLEAEAVSEEGDYYHVYQFEGFSVQIGYASFDI